MSDSYTVSYEIPPLDPEYKQKVVEALRNSLKAESAVAIQKLIAEDPDGWWVPYHFTAGMAIRNHIRDLGFVDKELPTGNWDDYYVEILEEAVK